MARKKPKKNLNDIVDRIVDQTYHILNWKIIHAMTPMAGMDEIPEGLPEDYFNYDHGKLDEVVEIVRPLLKAAQQTRKVEAETSQDVIKLISKGKITMTEAVELMSLVKLRTSVEEQELTLQMKKDLINNLDKTGKEEDDS